MKYPTTVGRILSKTSMWNSFFSPINVKLCHEWNEDQRRRRTRKMEEWFLAPAVGFHGMYFSYLQRRILGHTQVNPNSVTNETWFKVATFMKLTSKDHFDLGIIWYNQLSKLENLLEISRENWTFLKGNQRNNRILRNKSLKKFLSFWVIQVPPRVCCDFGMWFLLGNGNINRSFDLGPAKITRGSIN